MKVDFEPLAMKRTCDDWQSKAHKAQNWIPRVAEPNICIWTNDDGLPFNSDIPLMATEAYFPDIDDPAILFCANSAKHRSTWDSKRNKEIREMPRKCSKQISVEYACSNRTVVSPREYIEKFIYFEVRQLTDGLSHQEKMKIIGASGSEGDIYCWHTHMPDS